MMSISRISWRLVKRKRQRSTEDITPASKASKFALKNFWRWVFAIMTVTFLLTQFFIFRISRQKIIKHRELAQSVKLLTSDVDSTRSTGDFETRDIWCRTLSSWIFPQSPPKSATRSREIRFCWIRFTLKVRSKSFWRRNYLRNSFQMAKYDSARQISTQQTTTSLVLICGQ